MIGLVVLVIVIGIGVYFTNKQAEPVAFDKDQFYATYPRTEPTCTQRNGNWEQIGLNKPSCILSTTDAGTVCTTSAQCQGLCVTNDKSAKSGVCSNSTYVPCIEFMRVENGRAEQIICAN